MQATADQSDIGDDGGIAAAGSASDSGAPAPLSNFERGRREASRQSLQQLALLAFATVAIMVLRWAVRGALSDFLDESGFWPRFAEVVLTILDAVVGSALIFVWANLVMDQARYSWSRFMGLAGAVLGAVGGALLRGNRSVERIVASSEAGASDAIVAELDKLDPAVIDVMIAEELLEPQEIAALFTRDVGAGFVGHIEWSIVGAVLLGVVFALGSRFTSRLARLAVAAAGGVVTGGFLGSFIQRGVRPDLGLVPVVVAIAVGAALGAAWGIRSAQHVSRAFFGAGIGAIIGCWFLPELSTGTTIQTMIAIAVPAALLFGRFAWPDPPGLGEIGRFDQKARAVIFLAPALSFLAGALVIPALRTIYLSFLNDETRSIEGSTEYVGAQNYRNLFKDENFFNGSNIGDLFGSQVFWVAAVLVLAGVLIGAFAGFNRNRVASFDRTSGSTTALVVGVFLFITAVFATMRGTIINNLWWIFTVTIMSTVLGLTIAVLAERTGRLENVAKSLVFMPMAVSFVGASIVWRLQYQARDVSKNQTGVLNAVWVNLGELSHSSGPRLAVLVVLGVLIALLLWRAGVAIRDGRSTTGMVIGLIVTGYLFVELARRSLGGFRLGPDGERVAADSVFFVQQGPWNNIFLMIVLIWIQTGFAMVILSAAIKAVPGELLEASELDGATSGQQFFQVVLPQILPTVGVVVTTLIVLVTKVFDIVKVTTGGNFGTNVLANDMYTEAFSFFNTGTGSAIATLILAIVLPVLVFNVYQMTRAEA